MKKTITFIITFILLSSLVTAWGLTHPQPSDLQLKRGETARYWVTIDNIQGTTGLKCEIEDYASTALAVNFDNEDGEVVLDAASVRPLYGTITALETAKIGKNTLQFCPNCYSISEGTDAGKSGVVSKYCVPFKVEVVEVRTRVNPQEQIPPKPVDYTIYYLIGGIIVLLLILFWLYSIATQKPQRKRPTAKRKKAAKKTKKRRR